MYDKGCCKAITINKTLSRLRHIQALLFFQAVQLCIAFIISILYVFSPIVKLHKDA